VAFVVCCFRLQVQHPLQTNAKFVVPGLALSALLLLVCARTNNFFSSIAQHAVASLQFC
jgi:hypothetical protein